MAPKPGPGDHRLILANTRQIERLFRNVPPKRIAVRPTIAPAVVREDEPTPGLQASPYFIQQRFLILHVQKHVPAEHRVVHLRPVLPLLRVAHLERRLAAGRLTRRTRLQRAHDHIHRQIKSVHKATVRCRDVERRPADAAPDIEHRVVRRHGQHLGVLFRRRDASRRHEPVPEHHLIS